MCFSFRIIAKSLNIAEITVELGYNVMKGLVILCRCNRGEQCYGKRSGICATEYLTL